MGPLRGVEVVDILQRTVVACHTDLMTFYASHPRDRSLLGADSGFRAMERREARYAVRAGVPQPVDAER